MGMAAAKAKASPKKATAKATPKKKVGPDGPVSARQILFFFRSGAPPRAHHKLVGRCEIWRQLGGTLSASLAH